MTDVAAMKTEDLYDPFDAGFRADPYPRLHELRRRAPVYWSERLKGWVITSYRENEAVISRMDQFGAVSPPPPDPTAKPDARSRLQAVFRDALAARDGAQSARLRKLFFKAFTPNAVERVRARAQEIVDERLDDAERRKEFDLIRDLALPLPMLTICDMLGIPSGDQGSFARRAYSVIRATTPFTPEETFEQVAGDVEEMLAYTRDLIERRRREPTSDVLSGLVHAEEQGHRFTPTELLANVVIILAAGVETTQAMLGLSTLDLIDHPAERQRLIDDPALLPQAVEELMRHEGLGIYGRRVVKQEVDLGGERLRPGEMIMWCPLAANRDPSEFPDPDRLDVTRKDIRPLTFGLGPHYCIGASLARMELQVALGALLRRMPHLALRCDRREVPYADSPMVRGVASLPVSC